MGHECQWFGLLQSKYHGGLVAKLCPTLVTPWTVAYQAPLSMGILQARTLGCHTLPRGSSKPRDQTQVSLMQTDSLPAESPVENQYHTVLYSTCSLKLNEIKMKHFTVQFNSFLFFFKLLHLLANFTPGIIITIWYLGSTRHRIIYLANNSWSMYWVLKMSFLLLI